MDAASIRARDAVLREFPWAEPFGVGRDGKPAVFIYDGVQFDASGHLGEGDTEDAAWLDAENRLQRKGCEA